MSIIDDSGVLAIATRLMRLSEQLRRDGARVYKEYGIEFEPKWFPVIYVLYHKPLLSVVELAAEIGYTHPSTISLLKELEKQKLVRGQKDKSDQRKRLIRLTEQGRALVARMEPVCSIGRSRPSSRTGSPPACRVHSPIRLRPDSRSFRRFTTSPPI